FALAAMPPFGLFRSEFQIVAGGLTDHRNAAAVALVCLVTVAFAGLTGATTWILFAPSRAVGPGAATAAAMERGEPS
ncbi:proton-conducting transporter membrane subunit, partial [Mycobacterium kansasii]